MRNGEKDEIRMAEMRERMLIEGFRLFAEGGIEPVGMLEVAEACHLGIATLYRYFKHKLELVLAIGEYKWAEYGEYLELLRKVRSVDAMTAAKELEFYLDLYLDMYEHNRNLLRFNQNFNSFVKHEGATKEQLKPYLREIKKLSLYFHGLYEKGKRDGTIRTDMPEDKMFASTCHIMMAVGVRFAEGVLYDADYEADRTEEYRLLKRLLLKEFVIG